MPNLFEDSRFFCLDGVGEGFGIFDPPFAEAGGLADAIAEVV